MADSPVTPLTGDERAELEALRAEKARREEEERARAERAELEALRAEQAAQASVSHTAPAAEPVPAPAPQPAPAPEPLPRAEKTFGERMVTSDTVDGDGIPTMPMAQKIIIAVCLIAVICFAIYKFVL